MNTEPMTIIKLKPGDIGYPWDKCKRCFYLAAKEGIAQPMNGFNPLNARIEKEIREYFGENNLKSLYEGFPSGVIVSSNTNVESTPIEFVDLNFAMYISGKIDDLVLLDDGTYMLLKFATEEPKEEKIGYTTRQMNAYAWATENSNKPDKKRNITRLGMIIFNPILFIKGDPTQYPFSFVELEYQPEVFSKFLREVAEVLSAKEAPEPTIAKKKADSCNFCLRDNLVNERYLRTNPEIKELTEKVARLEASVGIEAQVAKLEGIKTED